MYTEVQIYKHSLRKTNKIRLNLKMKFNIQEISARFPCPGKFWFVKLQSYLKGPEVRGRAIFQRDHCQTFRRRRLDARK